MTGRRVGASGARVKSCSAYQLYTRRNLTPPYSHYLLQSFGSRSTLKSFRRSVPTDDLLWVCTDYYLSTQSGSN